MKSPNLKNITLCADDYGLNTAISQGIINLLQCKHLSAVSCLTTAPLWAQHAAWLKPFHGQVDIGLHFNLTEGKPLSATGRFFPLATLILRAFLRQLDIKGIEQECEAQLQRFTEIMGFLPDFIDGHQHIHQLPQVRTALLRVYEKHLRHKKAYVRLVFKQPQAIGLNNKIKQFIIYLCGSSPLRKMLRQQDIPHNTSFAGVYSFSQTAPYAQVFPYFLEKSSDQGLIMCHPALPVAAPDPTDAIATARFEEYSYLSSKQFTEDCKAANVTIRARLSP